MAEPAPIDLLRELHARLAGGDPLERWASECLAEYLEGAAHGVRLGQAFGVEPVRGEVPWWRREALARRDDAIRRLARVRYGNQAPNEQADRVLAELERYVTSTWRHDRARGGPRHDGEAHAALFDAADACDGALPASPRQVRRIIEAS